MKIYLLLFQIEHVGGVTKREKEESGDLYEHPPALSYRIVYPLTH